MASTPKELKLAFGAAAEEGLRGMCLLGGEVKGVPPADERRIEELFSRAATDRSKAFS